MLSLEEASKKVLEHLPDGTINASIKWNDNYLFSVYTSDPIEGELDPFYAVNVETGAFSGFSIVGDEDTSGILEAFETAIHTDMGQSFLEHYGVKGMKWGVRKDRKKSQKSGLKKASETTELVANVLKTPLAPFIPRMSVINKAIMIGMNVANSVPTKVALQAAFTSPVAIAGYAVTAADSGAYRVPYSAIKNAARGGWNKKKEYSSPKLSESAIKKKVVPGINKNFPGLGTTNNCMRCTYAYEMRRRGFDVAATRTMLASGQHRLASNVMSKALHVKNKIKPDPATRPKTGIRSKIELRTPNSKDIFRELSKQPNRSRGDLQMRWGPLMGGHSVAYEIINGKPVIFDTQSGKTYTTPASLNTLTGRAASFSFNRLDNKDLNDFALTAWLKDSK